MKKKKRNNKQKLLLNIKINKDLNWNDVEVITGYTRQNIDHAFKNGTQKTIDKVLEILESVWFFYAYSVDKTQTKRRSMLKILELFGGIGSPRKALINLGDVLTLK